MSEPRVAVVGGGILGLTAAYRLAQAGVRVTLYERSEDLGGLVGAFDFGGRRVDRFYHVVLPTDHRVRGLAEELGLGDRFRFRPTGVGFYDDGRLFSMSSLKEFATFPLLPPHDRLRLAYFVTRCQLINDHSALDDVPLLDWLRRLCGRRITERLWLPLLDSKFDGQFDDLPATYLWARTRRMSKTRDSAGREIMGWLEGGYETLIAALAAKVRELGGEIHAGTAVDQIVGSRDAASGVTVEGQFRPFDFVLCTLVPSLARRLMSRDLAAVAPEDHCRYLGVICLLLRTSESVSPYYTLNITDRRVPLTTVVETTHVVDPEHVGRPPSLRLQVRRSGAPGHAPCPPLDVQHDYLRHARDIFPGARATTSSRTPSSSERRRSSRFTCSAGASRLPSMFPVPGLALASTAHVYPENVNGQAVIGVADQAVDGLLERL